MASVGIGERLRNARTARGLTLEDIEAATRIKRHYLEALEREAWDELPGPTYVRGFLASYARQLGISVDEILGLYAAPAPGAGAVRAAPATVPRPVEVRITPANPRSRLRRIVTAIAVVFVAGAVVLAYILVGQLRQFAATRPHPEVSIPSIPAAGSPPGGAPSGASAVTPASGGQQGTAPGSTTAGQMVTPTSGTPATSGTQAVTPTGAQGIVVSAQATDRSWVRVVSDGAVVFEGFLSAGDHQVWHGKHQVSVRLGNASALDLSVNGQPLGRLGNPGDVVERTFSSGAPAAAPAPPPVAPAAVPSPPPAAPAQPAPPKPSPPQAPVVTPTGPQPQEHQ